MDEVIVLAGIDDRAELGFSERLSKNDLYGLGLQAFKVSWDG
jgi:hypothetical protein